MTRIVLFILFGIILLSLGLSGTVYGAGEICDRDTDCQPGEKCTANICEADTSPPQTCPPDHEWVPSANRCLPSCGAAAGPNAICVSHIQQCVTHFWPQGYRQYNAYDCQVCCGPAPLPAFTADPTSVNIQVGSQGTSTISGGQPPYDFQTQSDGQVAASSLSGNTLTVRGISSGATGVTIRDSAGATLEIGIIVNPQPTRFPCSLPGRYPIEGYGTITDNPVTTKYKAGRIFICYAPTADNIDQVVSDIRRIYSDLSVSKTGRDKINFPGIGNVDVIVREGTPSAAWSWQPDATPSDCRASGCPANQVCRQSGGAYRCVTRDPPTQGNRNPTLTSITATPNRVGVNGSFAINSVASDPDSVGSRREKVKLICEGDTASGNVVIVSITPGTVPSNAQTTITILGRGFQQGAIFQFSGPGGTGGYPAQFISPNELKVNIPARSAVGSYNVRVQNPNGEVSNQLTGSVTVSGTTTPSPSPSPTPNPSPTPTGNYPNSCGSVNEASVLAILRNYDATNDGIRQALPELQRSFGSQVQILEHPVRLDKIDFGNGYVVDVIAGATGTSGTWTWQPEGPCNSPITGAVTGFATVTGLVAGDGLTALTFYGQTKFWVLVSYFDALDAVDSVLDSDLDYLKSKGINGIRVFPTWQRPVLGEPFDQEDNDIFDTNGNVRPQRLQHLKQVIEAASRRGMIVDVTFAKDTVPGTCTTEKQGVTYTGMCPEEFKKGVVSVVTELKDYNNVFYDLSNEFDGDITRLAPEHVVDLKNRIKAAVPNAILSVSSGNE